MKKIPEIYVNNLNKINNNQEIYYSYKNNNSKVENIDVRTKINNIFYKRDYIYKKRLIIKTKYSNEEYEIIYKNYDYLLDINGNKIYIDNILDIDTKNT